jgi:dTDP-4-amino-4,6-dideoxygalactose transaminase
MWHLFPIHVEENRREDIFNDFRKAEIGVQVNYMPAYWHPVFEKEGFRPGMFPNSDQFYQTEISLPMWVSEQLTNSDYLRKVKRILGGL